MIVDGARPADAMFEAAALGNSTLTWALRVLGFLMLFVGISMVFRPLAVLADVVPLVGSFVGAGISLGSLLISAPLALVVIAVGWIVYRPLVAILLLLGALAAIAGGVFLVFASRRGKSSPATSAA
jgi:hypothetical protein